MENYRFDLPTNQRSIIKVIGVGGGGSNAVNYMYSQGIRDVEFIVCNTDAQALENTPIPAKLQLGSHLTQGLGAGANPEIGMKAAMESRDEVRSLLGNDTKMVFITAGMGGGTGTGAAPVIAKIAKEADILTVGIITFPFSFEGPKKRQAAEKGLAQLREACDTVIVISNDKLRTIFGNLSIRDAFSKADNVLTTAAKSIAELITVHNEINVDFQDVRTVMKDSGHAVMGSAVGSGQDRARKTTEDALSSPLLNDTDIKGAQKVLLSVSYGDDAEFTMDEFSEVSDFIHEQAGFDAEVIFGLGCDPALGNSIRVTVIATGFKESENKVEERKVFNLVSDKEPSKVETAPVVSTPIVEKQPEPAVYSQGERVVFNLDDSAVSSATEPTAATTTTRQEELPLFRKDESEEEIRERMLRQWQERQTRINQLNLEGQSDVNDFKQKQDIPAYLRRNVELKETPHSSEPNISRYNLNDDNELLGNNRFLHDNVD